MLSRDIQIRALLQPIDPHKGLKQAIILIVSAISGKSGSLFFRSTKVTNRRQIKTESVDDTKLFIHSFLMLSAFFDPYHLKI